MTTKFKVREAVVLIAVMLLGACGGKQPIVQAESGEASAFEGPSTSSNPIATSTTLRAGATKGLWQTESNPNAHDPMTRLPEDRTDGLRIERAPGAKVNITGEYADLVRLVESAEPILILDPENSAAWHRLVEFEELLIEAVRTGYKQWARHLRPQTLNVALQIGDSSNANCGGGHSTVGCYLPGANKVVLTETWMLRQYRTWRSALAYRRGDIATDVFFDVLHLVTHEAGHQFGYQHPQGITEGCGSTTERCHAPYGSGSVLSYDHLLESPTRYAPTKEDVEHIRDGRWNGDPLDRYTVTKTSAALSITSYGFWLDHEFYVTGWTGFGSVAGGNGSVRNEMMVQPFVNGTPSAAHGLRGNASWSGDFVGYDLHEDAMGVLTANADLTFRLASQTMDASFSGFRLWDGDVSRASNLTAYTYSLECDASACLKYTPGDLLVTAEFYRDGSDPSGYTAGIVNDYKLEYAGAFAAEKD